MPNRLTKSIGSKLLKCTSGSSGFLRKPASITLSIISGPEKARRPVAFTFCGTFRLSLTPSMSPRAVRNRIDEMAHFGSFGSPCLPAWSNTVVATCGTASYTAGQTANETQNTNGQTCS